eukprot:100506-Chlamydomonas_euryale.AAC.3
MAHTSALHNHPHLQHPLDRVDWGPAAAPRIWRVEGRHVGRWMVPGAPPLLLYLHAYVASSWGRAQQTRALSTGSVPTLQCRQFESGATKLRPVAGQCTYPAVQAVGVGRDKDARHERPKACSVHRLARCQRHRADRAPVVAALWRGKGAARGAAD